jgi:hypothetical protein
MSFPASVRETCRRDRGSILNQLRVVEVSNVFAVWFVTDKQRRLVQAGGAGKNDSLTPVTVKHLNDVRLICMFDTYCTTGCCD